MTSASSRHASQSAERQRLADEGPLRSAVIVNPNRVEDLPGLRRTVATTLAEAGWPEPIWMRTTAEDPGTGQARDAVEQGAEVVFVCGGDGTVRACVEGLAGTEAAMAILPGGTGNLLAGNLGLPDDPAEGVRVAVERGRHLLDVGEVDGTVFAVMAGMGFDAKMIDSASTELKARIGSRAYVLSALRHLLDRPMRVQVRIDKEPPLERKARSVIVGNVGRLQGGVPLFADAEPDSGELEVAILAPRHLGHWVSTAWGVLTRQERVPNMEVLRGRHIRVRSTEEQERQLDGDVIDPGRELVATVRPGAIWLCVYQPDRARDLAEGAP